MTRTLCALALATAAAVAYAAPAQPYALHSTTAAPALIDCEEDEACWIGSRDDSRDWAAERADALRSGWVAEGKIFVGTPAGETAQKNFSRSDCVSYAFPADAAGTVAQTLTRCADGREILTERAA